MKYLCVNCNYVYDESMGDETENIPSATKIEDIGACPICEDYDTFQPITEEIIYIEDNSLDKFEIEHDIDVMKKNGILEITIGRNMHPMSDEHRITWIGLFDEYGDLVEEEFLKIDSDSVVEFEDLDLGEYEVRIKCSMHNIFARKFK